MTKQSKPPTLNKLLPTSIRGRLLAASLLLLPLFCGLLGLSLDRAFSNSLRTGEQAQLTLHTYALLAAAEFEEQQLWLPEQLTEVRLNQPSSGLFAAVYPAGKTLPLWYSESAVGQPALTTWNSRGEQYGKPIFGELEQDGSTYFYLQYNVYWEDSNGTPHPFQFVMLESDQSIAKQLNTYRHNLWGWLSAIAVVITVLQLLIVRWGLKPIRQVSNDLEKIQTGQKHSLEGQYPRELKQLTNSINTLISNEQEQRTRYKNTLTDLAHSLKTPLTIMQGSLQTPKEEDKQALEQQICRMDQIISHQLKRTVNPPSNPFAAAVSVKESCDSVVAALKKVYRDKKVSVSITMPQHLTFRGDKGDLLEILGNLIDNAFKYGGDTIRITGATQSSQKLVITVEDNGPGVNSEHYAQLLKRGERADTSKPGQGIGLSVVADIVSGYRGGIELTRAPLGGLSVTVQL